MRFVKPCTFVIVPIKEENFFNASRHADITAHPEIAIQPCCAGTLGTHGKRKGLVKCFAEGLCRRGRCWGHILLGYGVF